MKIEMGESLIYSWLRHEKLCQLVQTNWKVSPFWELENRQEIEDFFVICRNYFLEKHSLIFQKDAVWNSSSSRQKLMELVLRIPRKHRISMRLM